MRRTRRSIQLLGTWLLLAAGSAHGDELYFENGDRLTGVLLSLLEGKIHFDSEIAGELQVAADQVRTLATDGPIEIHLSDQTVLHDRAVALFEPSGSAEPVSAPQAGGRYRVAGDGLVGPQSFALIDTVAINPPAEDPVDWSGRISVGASFERGNSIGEEANASVEVKRKTELSRITFRSSYQADRDTNTSTGVASTSDRLIKGFLKYDYFLTDRFYLFQSSSAERDGVKDLDLRLAIGGGTGYRWIATDTLSFDTEIGLAWTDERFEDSAADNDFLTALLFWDFDWQALDNFSVFNRGSWRPSLEEADVMVIEAEAGIRSNITSSFFLEGKIVWEWDAEVSSGSKRQDIDYIFGFGYRFD